MSTFVPCPPVQLVVGSLHHHEKGRIKARLESVHGDPPGTLRWVQQVRGMTRRAPRRTVLAVGVTAPLAPAPGAGARGAAGAVSLDVLA